MSNVLFRFEWYWLDYLQIPIILLLKGLNVCSMLPVSSLELLAHRNHFYMAAFHSNLIYKTLYPMLIVIICLLNLCSFLVLTPKMVFIFYSYSLTTNNALRLSECYKKIFSETKEETNLILYGFISNLSCRLACLPLRDDWHFSFSLSSIC